MVLSNISFIDMCAEWSDFYPVMEGTSEYFKMVIRCEHVDACSIDDEQYEKMDELLDELSYLIDIESMNDFLSDDNDDGINEELCVSGKKIGELADYVYDAFKDRYKLDSPRSTSNRKKAT